jgi:hypothetical protein
MTNKLPLEYRIVRAGTGFAILIVSMLLESAHWYYLAPPRLFWCILLGFTVAAFGGACHYCGRLECKLEKKMGEVAPRIGSSR